MSRRSLAVPGMFVPSSLRTTVTGDGSAAVMRSPIGTCSAAASAESVSSVGLPRPPSSADSVAFATPDVRPKSESDRLRSVRRRRRLVPTTLTISFAIANVHANGTNDLPGGRPARVAAGGRRRRLRDHLRRAGPPGRLRPRGHHPLLDRHVRRQRPVRRGLDRPRRRHGGRGGRRRAAAQRPLPADRPLHRAVAAGAAAGPRGAGSGRRRRVLGGQPSGRRPLRPGAAGGRRGHDLGGVGRVLDGGHRRRVRARRPRDARPRRGVPRALPRAARRPGPRAAAAARRAGRRRRRADDGPAHAAGRADRGGRGRVPRRRGAGAMSTTWIVVAGAGGGTLLLKGLAPAVLGGRTLPPRLVGAMALLAPTLLAALIVTNTFASGRDLVVDARAAGLAAALIAVLLRAPVLVVILVAAVTAGGLRALT